MASCLDEENQPVLKKNWYQTETHINLSILGKHIEKDSYVKFEKDKLIINGKYINGQSYIASIKLKKNIVPDLSSYRVHPVKIEIILAKTDGERWDELEKTESNIPKNAVIQTRNWDKLVDDMTKDDDDSDVNTLFKKIYSEGSDEVRKAMNKSFLESGGTVLSTNWKDVRNDKVQIKPPEGMEWKKWDE